MSPHLWTPHKFIPYTIELVITALHTENWVRTHKLISMQHTPLLVSIPEHPTISHHTLLITLCRTPTSLIPRPFEFRTRKGIAHPCVLGLDIIVCNYTYTGALGQVTMETQPTAMEKLAHVCAMCNRPFPSTVQRAWV